MECLRVNIRSVLGATEEIPEGFELMLKEPRRAEGRALGYLQRNRELGEFANYIFFP